MRHYVFAFVFVISFIFSVPVWAIIGDLEDKQQIEISAQTALEWDRAEQHYVATGDVEVKQGRFSVFSDVLMAYYRGDQKQGAHNIYRMKMENNVRISSPPYTAYGDVGEYDVTEGIAILTGRDLRIVTPDEVITARDNLEYNVSSQEFTARGKAHVVRGLHLLDADILTAKFKKTDDGNGNMSLARVKAIGHVVISTPTEKIYGENAIYNTETEVAVMTGSVRVEQGKNILKGTKVILNIKTGISQIFAEKTLSGKEGRVTGVFYPE